MRAPCVDCRTDSEWLETAVQLMHAVGFVVIEGVLDEAFRREARAAMYRAQARIIAEIGQDRLDRAGEVGVVRVPMRYDPFFFKFLEIEELLKVVDRTVGATAIMRLQNGLILPPLAEGEARDIFQTRFHMDFPRVLNGYLCAVNLMFAIDEYTLENGATHFIPGSHQSDPMPDLSRIRQLAVPGACPAGSMILFEGTVFHAAGANRSNRDRVAINHQFGRAYFKQEMDYVRAIGDEAILEQPPRTQQLLGWYTRVPASLDDYYQPADRRLYRAGQG